MGDTLTNTCINDTYESLIKTCNNVSLPSSGKILLSDGDGNDSSVEIGRSGSGITVDGVSTLCGNISQVSGNTTLCNTIVNGCLTTGNDTLLCNTGVVCGDFTTHSNNKFCGECTFIYNRAAIGSSNNQGDTVLTVKSECNNCSTLTLVGNNVSPYIRYREEVQNCIFSMGLDACDGNKFKIVNGPILSQNNLLVLENSGKVGVNHSPNTSSDEFTVCGNSLFSGNVTVCDCNLKLTQDSQIEVSNGTGTSDQYIGKNNGGCLEWRNFATIPGGDCIGNICTGQTTTKNFIPKFSNSTTLVNSNVCENNNIFTVNEDLQVTGTTTLNNSIKLDSTLKDVDNCGGVNGQFLSSTYTGVRWVSINPDAPKLETSSLFNVTGAICGTAQTFNGTQNVNIPVNGINASCLTSGTVPAARLPSINAAQLGGKPLATNCIQRNRVSWIAGDGVMEIGKYIDFHDSDSSGDYDARIEVNSSGTLHFNPNNNISCFIGSIKASGDIIAYCTSDKNLKNNIIKIGNSEEIINSISGYCYEWNEKTTRDGKQVGLIAQEVEKVIPTAVCTREDGTKALDYIQIIPVLVEEVKRLKELVNNKL